VTDDPEQDRIRTTYRRYDTTPAEQAKRDPGNPGNAAIKRHREAAIEATLAAAGLDLGRAAILDAGCGSGDTIAQLMGLGADPGRIVGVDLLEDRIDSARQNLPAVRFERADLRHLEFPDGSFDLVISSLLFGSILDLAVARPVAAELGRVLRPFGSVLWYEARYRNPSNPSVRPWSRRQISELFPGFHAQLSTITLLPPLARRLGSSTDTLYPVLSSVPVLRSHYIGLLRREAAHA